MCRVCADGAVVWLGWLVSENPEMSHPDLNLDKCILKRKLCRYGLNLPDAVSVTFTVVNDRVKYIKKRIKIALESGWRGYELQELDAQPTFRPCPTWIISIKSDLPNSKLQAWKEWTSYPSPAYPFWFLVLLASIWRLAKRPKNFTSSLNHSRSEVFLCISIWWVLSNCWWPAVSSLNCAYDTCISKVEVETLKLWSLRTVNPQAQALSSCLFFWIWSGWYYGNILA